MIPNGNTSCQISVLHKTEIRSEGTKQPTNAEMRRGTIAGRGRPLSLMQSKTQWPRWPNPSCEISGLTTMISATTWRMNCCKFNYFSPTCWASQRGVALFKKYALHGGVFKKSKKMRLNYWRTSYHSIKELEISSKEFNKERVPCRKGPIPYFNKLWHWINA